MKLGRYQSHRNANTADRRRRPLARSAHARDVRRDETRRCDRDQRCGRRADESLRGRCGRGRRRGGGGRRIHRRGRRRRPRRTTTKAPQAAHRRAGGQDREAGGVLLLRREPPDGRLPDQEGQGGSHRLRANRRRVLVQPDEDLAQETPADRDRRGHPTRAQRMLGGIRRRHQGPTHRAPAGHRPRGRPGAHRRRRELQGPANHRIGHGAILSRGRRRHGSRPASRDADPGGRHETLGPGPDRHAVQRGARADRVQDQGGRDEGGGDAQRRQGLAQRPSSPAVGPQRSQEAKAAETAATEAR